MPNVVRFTLSTARTLHVPGVGTFYSGVLDVDATNLAQVARTRYLLAPYRAVEVGTVDSSTPFPTLPAVPGPTVTPEYAPKSKRGTAARQRAPLNQWSSGREMCGADGGTFFSFNSTGLYQVTSATSGAWQSKGIPANTSATAKAKVVRFGAKLYLLIRNTVSSRFEVYSMDPVAGGTAFTYSAPLHTMVSGATIIGTVFTAGSQNLFLAEYGDPTGGPSIYRSANGTTWTTVLGPLAGVRHCHAVAEDPYNAGHIYASFGDGSGQARIYRSTSHGDAGTWTQIVTDADWQAVQISFTPELVWFASDQQYGSTVFTMDRTELVPRWQSKRNHQMIAVPGGVGGRTVTDLVTTSASATITSATAAFTAADVGRFVNGPNVINDTVYITAVTNATTATLSVTATGSGTALTATIGGDRFYGNAYFGLVDPATGIYYCVAADSSVSGNVSGLFCLFPGDDELTLLTSLPSVVANDELMLAGGYLWFHRYNRPVITV